MQRSAQAAVDPQTKPPDLGCESACRQLSSTTTIAIYYYYLLDDSVSAYDDLPELAVISNINHATSTTCCNLLCLLLTLHGAAISLVNDYLNVSISSAVLT